MTEHDSSPGTKRSPYPWTIGIAAVAILGIVVYVFAYQLLTGKPTDDAALLELNTQGVSEDPNAIADDLHATKFDDIDREMPELEAILSR